MHRIELPEDYALVLQQVDEDGEEDFTALAESLQLERRRLVHILQALRGKGLITWSRRDQSEPWIRLSAKGQRLIRYLWPESSLGTV